MSPSAGFLFAPSQVGPLLVIFRAADLLLGLPVAHVVEILRPLPADTVPGAPPFVTGLSLIRGLATPVVSMRALLDAPPGFPTRLAVLRTGPRRVALAVDAVEGLARAPAASFMEAPPLLTRIAAGALESVAALDGALLLVLEAGKLLGEGTWPATAESGA